MKNYLDIQEAQQSAEVGSISGGFKQLWTLMLSAERIQQGESDK